MLCPYLGINWTCPQECKLTSQEEVLCSSLHFIYKYSNLTIAQYLILLPTEMKLLVWIGIFATAALGKHTRICTQSLL